MTDTNNTVDAVAMIKEIYDKVVTSKDKAHKLHKNHFDSISLNNSKLESIKTTAVLPYPEEMLTTLPLK